MNTHVFVLMWTWKHIYMHPWLLSSSELIRLKNEMQDLNSKIKEAAADHNEDAIPRLRKKLKVAHAETMLVVIFFVDGYIVMHAHFARL